MDTFIKFPQRPILKSRSFLPNPVAKFGIPSYADGSIQGNNVMGTASWQSWWEEQFYYCINGYETGGIWIPGRYYYYLNFYYITTLARGSHHPDYVDLDLEWFYKLEEAKYYRKGLIMPKSRRKGITEKDVGGVLSYGSRFIEKYKAGIAAGDEKKINDFKYKIDTGDSMLAPELMLNRIVDNTNEIKFGWNDNTGDKGSLNQMLLRWMAKDPNLFKGLYLNDCIFEEFGEFDKGKEAYGASKQCFMVGDIMIGTPIIQGTGNSSKKGTEQMEEMYLHAEDFGLIKFFIPAKRMYFPFVAGAIDPETKKPTSRDGSIYERIPNLQHLEPYQRVGMEDEEAAQVAIDAYLDMLFKKPDKTDYLREKQNLPTVEADVFIRQGSNNFPHEVLNEQGFIIKSLPHQKYKHWKPDWIRDAKGQPIFPLNVVMTPLTDNDLLDAEIAQCSVMILDEGHPIEGFRNLEVGGIDSYDVDKSLTSKSLGAMTVLRQMHTIHDKDVMLPVALIRCRPRTKEKFYELCLMTSVYYKLYRNTLIDHAKPLIIQYYKENGGTQYLAFRPTKFESEYSKQVHEFGFAVTGSSQPKMIGLLQSYFAQHYHKIWFLPYIDEALGYDEGTLN